MNAVAEIRDIKLYMRELGEQARAAARVLARAATAAKARALAAPAAAIRRPAALLLAGLATVSVDIGQFVLMGEPLGTMGSQTIGRTVSTSAGVSRPTLYIEMRRDNEPVDPTGWWARPTNPIENG